jgi:hypothetical protein
MAALHAALQALSPLNFSDVPTSPDELDTYISDLFTKTELILESVPIPAPEDVSTRPRSATASSVASNTSEMSSSSARSLSPSPEHAALQKEWGKPIKVSGKDNPLNISVHKCSGKDGRGAWFARRSVHEGLGFARFKRGLEREFPETMKVQGAPGEGNIRGIGGEKKVEDITVDGKGRIEVYYLSAQFPGPTAPRDFVTFLVTSSKAMNDSHKSEIPELSPRHYMIISKPCNHPETPPKDGMVRGQYESVEFIREIPRRPKKTMSSQDLQNFKKDRSGRHSPNLEYEAVMRRTGNRLDSSPYLHENRSADDLPPRGNLNEGSARQVSRSPSGRARGATVGFPEGHTDGRHHSIYDDYDPEANPVEWIMITRSDPGGGIPRFMVERGTPGSIVADAYKFLNWATQQDEPVPKTMNERPNTHMDRRASFESWRANGTLAGISEHEPIEEKEVAPAAGTEKDVAETEPLAQSGIFANVTGALSTTINTYAPQAVLDRINGASNPKQTTQSFPPTSADAMYEEDDAASTISSTSFASADSHLGDTDDSPSLSSSLTSPSKERGDKTSSSPHDKELQKLAERRAALDKKLASSREKLIKDNENQSAKEKEALKKAEEKHEKELKKQEEKYKKEVARLEAKKEKEAKKIEERKKRQADKDEKARLTRERDEAREELEVLKKEREIWQKQVGDLQKENTRLMARVGKLEGMDPNPVKSLIDEEKGHARSRSGTTNSLHGARSRSASIRKTTPPLSP